MIDPGGVLGEIVARKRVDVAARLAGIGLADLRARAEPTRRSLKAALAAPGARFIMEVKRVSPSKGVLRAGADPAEIARGYAGAAAAIRVLIDEPYFGGSYADLEAVRRQLRDPSELERLIAPLFSDVAGREDAPGCAPRDATERRLGGAAPCGFAGHWGRPDSQLRMVVWCVAALWPIRSPCCHRKPHQSHQ